MNKATAIVLHGAEYGSDLIETYTDADKYIYINDTDQDLQKWRIEMPKPPDWSLIEGFGLPIREQKFKYETYPQTLRQLEQDTEKYVKLNKKSTDSKDGLERMYHERMWEILDMDREKYADVIAWIKLQWFHRIYGKWYFIKGKPVYINGFHHFFLNVYRMEGGTDNDGRPEFRWRDCKWFHAQQYAQTTTETVEYNIVEEDGVEKKVPIVLEDGTLKMRDLGIRTVLGTNCLKGRRVGDSSKTKSMEIDLVTSNDEFVCGMQADTDTNARALYSKLSRFAFHRLPFFFMPETPNSKTTTQISLKGVGPTDGLNSYVTFRASGETAYDGSRNNFFHFDECFGINTEVLMFNGGYKKIQDIKVGDYVIGEDGLKKKVLKTNKGTGNLYNINYKKGSGFICNENHILKTYSCYKQTPKKVDVILSEYESFSKNKKKHHSMYKSNGVLWDKSEHKVDPYFIGLFIGDGVRSSSGICNIDEEVNLYLNELALKHNLFLTTKNIIHSFSGKRILKHFNGDILLGTYYKWDELYHSTGLSRSMVNWANLKNNGILKDGTRVEQEFFPNIIRNELKDIGLLEKKFIPDSYIYDSYENRLQLLAGLIDSDGSLNSKNGNDSNYEITQKYEHISNKICFLAQTLGLYANCLPKTARMKRHDGSYYECKVYRVNIYGDINKIPCRVERKKVKNISKHKNRRNPLRFGFNSEYIGIGDYYGITVEENSFLLSDFTVVHNCGKTKNADIRKRHEIVARTLTPGVKIRGSMVCTSTAEEMESTVGQNFEDLTNESMFEDRGVNGRTKTGLINIYFSIEESFEGFVDPWGYPIIENPTDEYIIKNMAFIERNENGQVMGVREYLKKQELEFIERDDMNGLSSFQRKNPKSFRECFANASMNLMFDRVKLQGRLAQLKYEGNKCIRGNFRNHDNVVTFVPDENGRFNVSKQLPSSLSSRMIMDYSRGSYRPEFNDVYVACGDTFKASKTDSKRKSLGSGAVLYKHDPLIDSPDKPTIEWETKKFVCTFLARPDTVDEYCQDMLNMCIYYGAMMYPESDLPSIQEYFTRKGFAGYLLHDVDVRTGKMKESAGWTGAGRGGGDKEKLFNYAYDWVNLYSETCDHPEILQELLDIKSFEDMKNRDLFVSIAGCLRGESSSHLDRIRRFNTTKVDITGFYKKR